MKRDGSACLHPKRASHSIPGQFVITLKLNELWGSCYTALDGGFVKTISTFTKRLVLDQGLTLEVYKHDAGEKVGIKCIEVTILYDA